MPNPLRIEYTGDDSIQWNTFQVNSGERLRFNTSEDEIIQTVTPFKYKIGDHVRLRFNWEDIMPSVGQRYSMGDLQNIRTYIEYKQHTIYERYHYNNGDPYYYVTGLSIMLDERLLERLPPDPHSIEIE